MTLGSVNTRSASLRDALAVFLGGALGTLARVLLIPGGAPVGVFIVNLVGAAALGVVTGVLLRTAQAQRTRRTRLFLGTGLLGGFTTYSAFALIATDPSWLWWAAVTAIAGPALAFIGIWLGRGGPARGAAGREEVR